MGKGARLHGAELEGLEAGCQDMEPQLSKSLAAVRVFA